MGTLVRRDHWATREFHDFILQRAKMPFAWGTNDCAMFAADGVEAITGTDIATAFRGRYGSELSAMRTVKEICGGATIADAAAWCAAQHGLEELLHPLLAQRGDLVLVADAGREIAGLVHLSGRHVVTVGEEGLKRVCITAVRRAWRV